MLQKNNLGIYSFPEFSGNKKISCGFSSLEFGNMSFNWGENREVIANRKRFALASGFDDKRVVQAKLSHSTGIAIAKVGSDLYSKDGLFEGIDALMTAEKGLVLWMLTADCLPVIFYDPVRSVIAVAHCGYKGAIGKLPVITAAKMVTSFGSKPENIVIGLGPGIRKCCYLVEKPVMQENLPEWEDYLQVIRESVSVDLTGFTVKQLEDFGILPDNIMDSNICTVHDHLFYSENRSISENLPQGRFATFVEIK